MTDTSKEVVERLRAFAQGCRGSMWQSRDETIKLMDDAADTLRALQAENERLQDLIREAQEVICNTTCPSVKEAALDAVNRTLATKGRPRGGAGGQTVAETMRSTFHEISAWDLETILSALSGGDQ